MEAMKRIKVYSTYEKYQAELILGILRNNQIPCYRQGVGMGGYMDIYAGNSLCGEEIYVDERDAEKALELIRQTVGADEGEAGESLKQEERGRFTPIVRIGAWIWVIVLIAALLSGVFSSIFR